MSVEHPELGEIRTSKELNFNSPYKWMWDECVKCHKPRWVKISHGQPISKLHKECYRIDPNNIKRKQKLPLEDMTTYKPQANDMRRGYQINKGINNYQKYIWTTCPDCNTYKWSMCKNGTIPYPRCLKCGKKLSSKLCKGKLTRKRAQHSTNISLGDIRCADEIGYKHTGRKYMWSACKICGKERWVALIKSGQLQNTHCTTCAKVGSIKNKSLKPTRKCSKCHNEFPATSEYFRKATKSYRGISCVCKKCANKQASVYTTKRRRSNPHIRLHANISKSISDSIKGHHKKCGWEKLVGYTTKQLMTHLEKQFANGMNWDNYGKNGWAVDHICPQSLFNYSHPSHIDFKRCWQLSNLQPMWHKDNIAKSNKYDLPFQPALQIGERKEQYGTN